MSRLAIAIQHAGLASTSQMDQNGQLQQSHPKIALTHHWDIATGSMALMRRMARDFASHRNKRSLADLAIATRNAVPVQLINPARIALLPVYGVLTSLIPVQGLAFASRQLLLPRKLAPMALLQDA